MNEIGTLPKTHLSPSQINTFLACPARYYFRYVMEMQAVRSGAMTRGSAIHKAIAYNYEQKMMTHTDLPVNEVKEFAAAEFEKQAGETNWQPDEQPGEVKDSTIKLLELYQREVAATVQPFLVEQMVEVNFENTDYTLLGYIDLVDEKRIIHDTKTVGRSPSAGALTDNVQMLTYSLAYRFHLGENEAGSQIDYLVNNKTPKYVPISGEPYTDREIDRLLNIVASVANAIQAGGFYPNPSCFTCSPKACGFWEICHQQY